MTLVKVRAALEKSITDEILATNPRVKIIYDNIAFTTPSKNVAYVVIAVNFGQATKQNQGAATPFYSGFIQCDVYVPKGKGTSKMASISEAVITGMTAVNAPTYVDKYSCNPRTLDVVGPGPIDNDQESHFLGVISCQFSAST
tara:strand:+ start:97 stop:525 length:429 start_codon:yes stop_codon:yes gene_type:complete